jgi:NAD-dependent deacetylase sirtuin 5
LFDVKCTSFYCSYQADNFIDPITPALRIPLDEAQNAVPDASKELDISDSDVHLPRLRVADLPKCPECHRGLLRPGVVWFGESLPSKVIDTVDRYIDESPNIDLMLVIGTSARVFPAAGYVDRAVAKGARVAVINADRADEPACGLSDSDWFFQGDAAQIVPDLLQSVIGEIKQPSQAL